MFSWFFNSSLVLRILAGLVLGVVAGLTLDAEILSYFYPMGEMFLNALKMIVVPVVISSIVVGTASIDPRSLGRIGGKVVLVYALYTIVAIAVGLFMADVAKPGQGIELVSAATSAITAKAATAPSISQMLVSIIPTNIVDAMVKGSMLQIIFFSILFGVALAMLSNSSDPRKVEQGKSLITFFEGISEVTFLMIRWVIQMSPFGVFALIAKVVAAQGSDSLVHLGYLVGVVYTGYILFAVIVYSVVLKLAGINPLHFFSVAKEAIITAFVTRSSSGVLPITLKNADELGICRSISSFSIPLGATVNMNGTALYIGVCTVFIGYATGVELSLAQQATILLTATLAAIGTAGVPGSGVIMLYIALESVGLRIENGSAVAMAYAMVLSVDALLDMGRTAVNVAGDIVGTAVVAKSEKLMK